MTTITTVTLNPPQVRVCSAAAHVTRSLLGYLALGGPFYVVVSLAQAVSRPGFSVVHNEWSLLALGHFGWVQTTNLVLTGAMTVAGAVGLRRAFGRCVDAGTWAPRLLAAYGLSLIGAGIFRADPAGGFPPGAPRGQASQLSWHATLHIASGSIGFACLIAACFVIARGYHRRDQQGAAIASRAVGVAFVLSFLGIASGTTSGVVNLGFTAAVVVSSAWLTVVAIDHYRQSRSGAASTLSVR